MKTARTKFLLLLLMGAFVVRFGAVLALRDIHRFHGAQAGADAVEFNTLALHLANGSGYTVQPGHSTSFRAPGFPLFMAGLYKLSYENYPLIYLAQCLLGVFACGLTYLLARELLPERNARVAGVLAAVFFPGIYDGTLFLSETLFSFCLAAGLLAFTKYLRGSSLYWLFGAGLLLGWATLTRPFALLLLPAFCAILMFGVAETWRRRALTLVIFAVAFAGVIAPWTARNYLVHGKPILIATNGGSTFYGGNNDRVLTDRQYWGGWISTVYLPGRALIEAAPNEVEHDQVEWRLGLQWVRAHLAEIPKLSFFKTVRFWLPDLSSGNRKFVMLEIIGYSPFLVLFLLAAVRCVRNPDCWTVPWLAIHLTMAAAIATALVFWGSPRFRDANFPVLMLYGALVWPPIKKSGDREMPSGQPLPGIEPA